MGSRKSNPDVIILVGGYGSRLRSIIHDRPKPLAEFSGRPILKWILQHLEKQGFYRMILATGFQGQKIESYFSNNDHGELQMIFSREATPLGTGGAIRQALPNVTTEQVLIINGDSFCPFHWRCLSDFHAKHNAEATLCVVPMKNCDRYGSVETGAEGRITGFLEKGRKAECSLVSAGIYLLERRVLEIIPPGKSSLEREIFPRLIGRRFYAAQEEAPLHDIGTPEGYEEATRFFSKQKL